MKIYTKKGDQGKTDLIGKRVLKYDDVIEFNGILDETSAFLSFAKIGLLNNDLFKEIDRILLNLGNISFEMAGGKMTLSEEEVIHLEKQIDHYESLMPKLTKFIKFDKNKNASVLNISRTVIRRAERKLVYIDSIEAVNPHILKYLNRLSDLLFVIARYIQEAS